MKKILYFVCSLLIAGNTVFAQSDDDLFFDDGIEELEVNDVSSRQNDLNHGILFEAGSVKVGGQFDASATLDVPLYKEGESLKDNFYNATGEPSVGAFLFVDARPTQDLRMYAKFGLGFPFCIQALSLAETAEVPSGSGNYLTQVNTSIIDWFKLKELFTDFSFDDKVFCRFGLHTVTWGTGVFYSPVSDIINSSSIDPQDTSKQVDGSVNLRAQIPFGDTKNCLWLYAIPSTDIIGATPKGYLRDSGFAAKGEVVLGNWELGLGGYFKYQAPFKVMSTFSGGIGNLNLFGEAVYQYGTETEWKNDSSYDGKSSVFLGSIGALYLWNEPKITLLAQYYYDGNKDDMVHKYFTHGHNIAGSVSFGKVFGSTDWTCTLFGMGNTGKDDLPPQLLTQFSSLGLSESYLASGIFSGMLTYAVNDNFSIGAGPYVMVKDWSDKPVVSFQAKVVLGGGKF